MFNWQEHEDLLETSAIILAIVLSGLITYILTPAIMRKMKERGIVGSDWNKKNRQRIPELGGISVLFGFTLGISITTGFLKLLDNFNGTPILAAIGVLFVAGMIGIIDDISDIPQRIKAIVVAFAALPLLIDRFGDAIIDLPFGLAIDLSSIDLIYWLVLVPIGITGIANAINMSAGYNGLETGQVSIISFCLLIVALTSGTNMQSVLVFAGLLGAAIGLNYFNGFPALTFVGDVGTLAMGATIGAGVIMGGIEFWGLIAIAPAFYEGIATAYYSFVKKVNRKEACSRPVIDEEGRLHPPKGAEKYTLAYQILNRKPMKENQLVRTILMIYLAFGALAIVLSLL